MCRQLCPCAAQVLRANSTNLLWHIAAADAVMERRVDDPEVGGIASEAGSPAGKGASCVGHPPAILTATPPPTQEQIMAQHMVNDLPLHVPFCVLA